MSWPEIVATAVLASVTVAFWWAYLWVMRSTDRRVLDVPEVVRWGRQLRAQLATLALAVPAWPHLVELALGLHRTPTALSPRALVGQNGPAQLFRYLGNPQGPPVLLVHSVVTTPSVLDLTPGLSLVEALVQSGYDVWLLDWGRMGRDQADWGLAAYAELLHQTEEHVARQRGSRVHVVGYCAGGTVAIALHATRGRGAAASLALVAAPVDTAAAGGFFSLMRNRFLLPGLLLDGDGLVPPAMLREAFHALRPQAVRTMRKVMKNRHDGFLTNAAGAIGRWAWEQTPVPGALMLDMVDLARDNSLVGGTLTLGGVRADLHRLAGLPLLTVTTARDHIVPPGSTAALRAVPGLEVEELQCAAGHVSMLVGAEAHRVVFPGITRWLGQQPL